MVQISLCFIDVLSVLPINALVKLASSSNGGMTQSIECTKSCTRLEKPTNAGRFYLTADWLRQYVLW